MNPRHLSLKYAALSFLFLIFSTLGFAQSSGSGSGLSGFVYEEGDKPLDGVTISIRNTATGFTTLTATNKKGYFTLSDVPVGTYTIEISTTGFQPTVLKDNILNLGDRLVLHKITLSKSAATLTEVTVHSTSFNNSVDRLGTGTAVSSRALQKIPVATRNYTDLMMLSPLPNGSTLAAPKARRPRYILAA